jgi:hypothetical protein
MVATAQTTDDESMLSLTYDKIRIIEGYFNRSFRGKLQRRARNRGRRGFSAPLFVRPHSWDMGTWIRTDIDILIRYPNRVAEGFSPSAPTTYSMRVRTARFTYLPFKQKKV